MNSRIQYSLLSELFRYPTKGYQSRVLDCSTYLESNYKEAAHELSRFADVISSYSIEEIEELFGKTFHIQAICFLDIGYVLFGEDYKRGEFLVHMKKEQAKVNNYCGEELPDNLANVLTLLVSTDDDEFLHEMSVRILMPALSKMLEEFDAKRMELKKKILKKKHRVLIQENINHGNIYFNALKALLLVLEKDFSHITYEPTEVKPQIGGVNFLANCESCSVSDQEQPQTAK